MIHNVTLRRFITEFREYGRHDQFSGRGMEALYDYLTDLESDTGTKIQLDVIALCCEFSEYDSVYEAAEACGVQNHRRLHEHVTVIPVKGGGVIIGQ
jgi:hypothetical protein